MTTLPKRHRNAWGCNEVNRLHNEYELKRLTVQEIAALHERTVSSIMYKLKDEELISNWEDARGTRTFVEKEKVKEPLVDYASDSASESDSDHESDSDYNTDSNMPPIVGCESEYDSESEQSEYISMKDYIYNLEDKILKINTFLKSFFGDEYSG